MRNDTDKFRALLNQKEAQLLAALKRSQAAVGDSAPDVQDETDQAVEDEEKDAQFDENSREFSELTEVRDAIDRIRNGTYGECEVCGRQIEEARLQAIPWARLCIDDARATEGTITTPTL